MIGRYEIEVYNARVHYFLTIKRNITILQGYSATGKTELIRLISDYEANGSSSGITVKCDVSCTVLTSIDWEVRINSINNHIVFIDETARFYKSKRFSEYVRGSDNYFVIITRDDLPQLPYSVEEIYGLKNVSDTNKYKEFKKAYNEMYKLYNLSPLRKVDSDVVITEDSNSGYECFNMIYNNKCISANGKSGVYDLIRRNKKKSQLAVVDGAAFGSEIGKIYRYLKANNVKCVIYAPESFEYIVLKAGIVDVAEDMILETYRFADSRKYLSWEEYYNSVLIELTNDTPFRYDKSRLNESYKSSSVLDKIVDVLPEYIK